MSNDTPDPRPQQRLFSEQLMVEFGQQLLQAGLLQRAQLDELNARRMLTGASLDRLLVAGRLVPEADILTRLSALSGIPFRHITSGQIEPGATERVPARVAIRYRVMPLSATSGTTVLAVAHIPDSGTADSLRMLLNSALEWVLCTESDLNNTIKHFYGLGAEAIDPLLDALPKDAAVQAEDVSADSENEGIVRFVNQLIGEAIRMDATDIHIEPLEDGLRLRYRIDGVLQDIPVPKGAGRLSRAIVSAVKIMADMNIAERRKPHDGRIKVRSGNEEFDLRVSLLPTPHGETVAMRVLNRKAMFIDLEHLGLTADQQPAMEYLSNLPHGVVLLTGPTGSGKTTTLYATLARISSSEVKIITVEDPIEYQMPGITQIQAHAHIGLTFASILRSILRHDPDIVLIGEIRDTETADIAVRASLTGHLVFSTLHTNDAPSAVTRLADMGIEPYLISSCLEGAIAQRLVRRTCGACAEPDTPEDVILEEIRHFHPTRLAEARFLKGRGCPNCNFTGYRGRLAIFEIMVMNDELRSLVVHQRPANEIGRAAMRHGMATLRQDGWLRVLRGQTTPEEVVRVARKLEDPALAPAS